MNKMFNKSVIAVALLGTFAVSAAGTLDVSAAGGEIDVTDATTKSNDVAGIGTGAIWIAKELLDNALDVDVAEAICILAQSEYSVAGSRALNYSSPVALKNKSTLVFKFAGGAVEANAALKLYTVTAAGTVTEVGALTDFVADDADNYTSVKFQLGSDVALNKAMVVGSGVITGDDLADLVQPTFIVADGSLALTVSVPEVRDDNAQLLSAPVAGAETIATVANNFKAFVVTKNTDKIDVTKARKYFTDSATDNVSQGTVAGALTDANFVVANGNIVYPTSTTYSVKVTGTQAAISKVEFGATALTASSPAGSYSKSGVGPLSTLIGASTAVKATTKTGSAAVAIEEAAYPVSLTLPATASTKAFTLLADTVVLDWKLNAATATIPYMPVGAEGATSDTQNVIYVTNKGSTVGNIYVDVWSEAGVKVLTAQNVGTTKANGITKIGSKIKELLDAADVSSQKVTVKVIAEVPQAEFEVFSAFTVSGNRQIVINDSNVTTSRNGNAL